MGKRAKGREAEAMPATGVAFIGTATRLVSFSELEVDPATIRPQVPGQRKNVQLQLAVTVAHQEVNSARVAEVTLDVTLTPDPTHQPYRIQVVMSGVFRSPENAAQADFEVFCKQAAPVIIWPYIRALVSSLTLDARFGVVRLDPVNLTSVMREEGWKAE